MISSPPPYYNFKRIPAVIAPPYDFGNPLPYIRSRFRAGSDSSDTYACFTPASHILSSGSS